MRISIFACLILPAALGVACSPPAVTDAGTDAAAGDVTVTDAPSVDVAADHATNDVVDAATADVGPFDATPIDGATADVPTVDVPSDNTSTDGATEDAADASTDGSTGCDFIDTPSRLALCSGAYVTISEWVNISGPSPACPPYYSAGSTQAGTIEELLTAIGCAGGCFYRADTAVQFLHCGHRDEYISYAPERSGCNPLLMFSDGMVYASIDDYNAANPCP